MAEQKATVGRTVRYQSLGTNPDAPIAHPSESYAAIVTAEGECDDEVSLCVLYPNGFSFKQNVPFSAEPTPGYWNWPPRV